MLDQRYDDIVCEFVYVIMKSMNLFAEACSHCCVVVALTFLICHNIQYFTRKKYKFITKTVFHLDFIFYVVVSISILLYAKTETKCETK